jgi:alpha-tubulin suppressor-like RCC1 family protein
VWAATPQAATQPAFQITSSSATLQGMALPNDEAAEAWFEWGTNTTYGQLTPAVSVGNGSSVVRVGAPVSGLNPGEIYAFRLAVSNASGVTFGAPQTFATGKKLAAWGDNSYGQSAVPNGLTQAVAAACGYYHSLALDVNGKVQAWGYNSDGQTNVPGTLSNVVAVAGGTYHSLALRNDGTLVGWGYNLSGQASAPAGVTNIIAITAGRSHSLALRADGIPVVWGSGFYGQTNMPAGLSNVVAVACGDDHSVVLLADGTVRAWGDNIFGQSTVPGILTNVISIAAGSGHSIAVKADGTVTVWGWPLTTPAGLNGVTAAAGGWVACLALTSNRTVTGWGSSFPTNYLPPPGLVNVATVSAQGQHNLAIADNSPPITINLNQSYPHNQDAVVPLAGFDPNGDPLTYQITSLPTNGGLYQYVAGIRGDAISAMNTPVSDAQGRVIYAPPAHAFGSPFTTFNFLAHDGKTNSGVATLTLNLFPAQFAAGPATELTATNGALTGSLLANGENTTAWFQWGPVSNPVNTTPPISFGPSNTLARLKSSITGLSPGTLYQSRLIVSNAASGFSTGAVQRFTAGLRLNVWGSGAAGQTNFPANTTNITALAAGGSHCVALRNDGTVLAWGLNTSGQTNNQANLTNAIAVAAGGAHSLALLANGRVRAWGRNTSGQTNVPSTLTNAVTIGTGFNHCLAVRADGRVVAWGDNAAGQTNVPVTVSNVIAVAGGLSNSFALRADGTVAVWGGGIAGLTTVPTAATNVIAIAAGNLHALALRLNGTIVAWGTNNLGQTNVPAGLSNVVAIAAGANHSLALKADGTVVAWGSGALGQTNVPASLSTCVSLTAGDSHSASLGNSAPTANALNGTGYVNHDLVLTLSGTDLNKDGLNYRLLSVPLQGTVYQYNAGSRGAVLDGGNPNVTDAAGRLIYAPASNVLGAQFATFVANDGVTDSAAAQITANISLPAAPVFNGSTTFSNGVCQVNFTGSSNATYSVWASTNLTTWERLGTANPLSGTQYDWSDLDATNWQQRFYRASAP